MANNDILQYLRKTPHNTNVNVVKGMIGDGNGSGAIEMETVFEDDITLTYNGNGYSFPYAIAELENIQFIKGYLKVTFDNYIIKGIITSGFSSSDAIEITCSDYYNLFSNTNHYGIGITYQTQDTLVIRIDSYDTSTDQDLQTYCQTPHHLKIELFNL